MNTIRNDFGKVKITKAIREAYRQIEDAAWTLQVTPGEFCEMLAEENKDLFPIDPETPESKYL